MEEYTFLAPLLLTIGGLIIGAILKSLLKHSRLPYTVGLFAIGIILAYIIHSGFISGYQNRYGDNLKPPTNVYHRMTA